MATQSAKKLVYLLNFVHEHDVQHFVHVLHLLGVLRARGWSVTLLSEKGGDGSRVVHGQEVRYLSRSSKLLRVIRLVSNLVRLRREGYRLVFVRISKPAAIISALVGKLIGLKVLYWQSGMIADFDRQKPLWKRAIETARMKLLIALIDRFVTGPETMLDYYAREYGVPRRKLMLLYNDVDPARFPAVVRERDPGDPVRILFVHSLSPVRNTLLYMPAMIASLNRAAAGGARIEFDLIGRGPEREEVERIVAGAGPGLTVRMLGGVPNTSLPERYAAADLFVMPSYREGMPRALMEAMSTGLPAVSTDAGGTRDLVGPLQDAFVVSRDDPQGFADRLYELVCDAALRRRIGEENRVRAQRYTTEVVAEMYDARLSGLAG